MLKIAIDTLGGDNSPAVNIEGAVRALNEISDLFIVFVGNEADTKARLAAMRYDESRVAFVNAPDEIGCDEKPTDALKNKPNSSLFQTLELLRTSGDVNAMVSCGSSGAILAGAILRLGRIKGIKRPAFCPVLPTMDRRIVAICDSGANVDCDALQLKQFAVMGSLYLKCAHGVENPRVALLNVGVEAEKGDVLRKEVYTLLQNTPSVNFVGNMESRDLLKGSYDLVVCDGFSGNVLLKSTEGACLEMLKMLKCTFYKNLKNKIGALLMKKDVMATKDFMDYNNYGGAVLLGTTKTVVKSHGSSTATSVYQSVKLAYEMEKNKLRESIAAAAQSDRENAQ